MVIGLLYLFKFTLWLRDYFCGNEIKNEPWVGVGRFNPMPKSDAFFMMFVQIPLAGIYLVSYNYLLERIFGITL
jgi:ABC-type polysaccharide transport system permease subunit